MGGSGVDTSTEPPDIIERESLCFARSSPAMVVHGGEDGFREELSRLYLPAESNAAEKLIKLKEKLRKADSEAFWPLLTEGLAGIADAQYAFVSKRILLNDENIAVEMPPIGEPGACLMGAAFYVNDGHGVEHQLRNFKYHAYSCPCAYMRHDKIFIIPERLNEFITNNPNNLRVPGEAYFGIPLFAEGKCFAHFGVMWSPEGAAKRNLGWGYLEMLLHSLEDLILGRVLEGKNFATPPAPATEQPQRVVPHEAISVAQSLKPYARSLSHELRTPMQGVVGMLDVMYATVQEAAESQVDPRVRKVFDTLKDNIEAVQDSSRRAVEAADNVVHAYDMNMGVPDTPLSPSDNGSAEVQFHEPILGERRPDILVTGNNIPLNFRVNKRRRENYTWSGGNATKIQATESNWISRNYKSEDSRHHLSGNSPLKGMKFTQTFDSNYCLQSDAHVERENTPSSPVFASEHSVVPGLRHTNLREVLQYVINDSLKVGGRPESAIAHETDGGETIEVRTRSPSGQEKTKIIEWKVDPNVPETILIDEKDLAKMISCVALNAMKFTDRGIITLTAQLSPKSKYIIINVKDTGSGIPAAFLPNLFKPFSREDDSLTRQSEGLGLGLLVAKGLARKLGGDLFCLRSDVSGPNKGSEFEMRVPLTPGDVCSRPGSSSGSPTPSIKSRLSAEVDVSPMDAVQPPQTPPTVSEALKAGLRDSRRNTPSNPPTSFNHLSIPSPQRNSSPSRRNGSISGRWTSVKKSNFDRNLAKKHPLNFLVVEDNKINRKLLVSMLHKLGYRSIFEAYDGRDAVHQMEIDRGNEQEIDVILMDLWMPFMDGYQAAEAILRMDKKPTILAVTADVTDGALERAAKAGMKGFMTKPFQILDLEKLIVQYCASRTANNEEAVSL